MLAKKPKMYNMYPGRFDHIIELTKILQMKKKILEQIVYNNWCFSETTRGFCLRGGITCKTSVDNTMMCVNLSEVVT